MSTFVNREGNVSFHIPEKRSEITKEYIDGVLEGVKLSEHYCIIGLIFMGSLAELINVKSNKINVVPILCKYNSKVFTDDDLMKVVNIDRTSIERGNQVYNIKNEIGMDSIKRFIDDNGLGKSVMMGGNRAVAIEFKIVPVSDIRAVIDDSYRPKSIFKTNIVNTNEN